MAETPAETLARLRGETGESPAQTLQKLRAKGTQESPEDTLRKLRSSVPDERQNELMEAITPRGAVDFLLAGPQRRVGDLYGDRAAAALTDTLINSTKDRFPTALKQTLIPEVSAALIATIVTTIPQAAFEIITDPIALLFPAEKLGASLLKRASPSAARAVGKFFKAERRLYSEGIKQPFLRPKALRAEAEFVKDATSTLTLRTAQEGLQAAKELLRTPRVEIPKELESLYTQAVGVTEALQSRQLTRAAAARARPPFSPENMGLRQTSATVAQAGTIPGVQGRAANANAELADQFVKTKLSSGPAKAYRKWMRENRGDISKQDALRELDTIDSISRKQVSQGGKDLFDQGEMALLREQAEKLPDRLPGMEPIRGTARQLYDPRTVTKLKKGSATELDFTAESMGLLPATGAKAAKVVAAVTSPLDNIIIRNRSGIGQQSLGRHVREWLSPFYDLEGRIAFEARRGKFLGGLQKVDDAMNQIAKRYKPFDEVSRKRMFQAVRQGNPSLLDDPLERLVVQQTINQNNLLGRMLVSRGLISQAQFDDNAGQFIHYMYLRNILGEKKFGQLPTVTGTQRVKLGKDFSNVRGFLSADQQKAFGLIEDIAVAQQFYAGSAMADIARYDFQRYIKDSFGLKESLIGVPNGTGKKFLNMNQLDDGIEIMGKELKGDPTNQAQRDLLGVYKGAKDQLTSNLNATMPDGWEVMPRGDKWGLLSGEAIPKPIIRDINNIYKPFVEGAQADEALSLIANINAAFVGAFKISHVPFHIPTVARNVMSNPWQILLSGASVRELPGHMRSAATSLRMGKLSVEEITKKFGKKEAAELIQLRNNWGQASRRGLFKTNFEQTELNQMSEALEQMGDSGMVSMLRGVAGLAKKGAGWYGKIDDYFKMVKFNEMVSTQLAGDSIQKVTARGGRVAMDKIYDNAAREAQKWIMDYSLVHPAIGVARKHMFPFLSFKWKAQTLWAEAMIERPFQTLAMMSVPIGATALALETLDIDEKQFRRLRRQLPEFITRNHTMAMIPWAKSKEDNPIWLNTEYLMPWGDVTTSMVDVAGLLAEGEIGKAGGRILKGYGFGNPFYDMWHDVASQSESDEPFKDSFSQRAVYNSFDTPGVKAAKISRHFMGIMMGSAYKFWEPSSTFNKIARLATEKDPKRRTGEAITPARTALELLGLRTYSPLPQQAAKEREFKAKRMLTEFARIKKDPTISNKDKRKSLADLKAALQDLTKKRLFIEGILFEEPVVGLKKIKDFLL